LSVILDRVQGSRNDAFSRNDVEQKERKVDWESPEDHHGKESKGMGDRPACKKAFQCSGYTRKDKKRRGQ